MTCKWSIPFVALALVGGGCAMRGSETRSDTSSAQQAAESQFQRAADAQKKAREEQNNAEQADKDVADAQKALAQAEAKAQGQHARAKQSQETARSLAQTASQQALQEQGTASKSMERETSQRAQEADQRETWRDEKTISGRVVNVDSGSLRVHGNNGDVSLSVNDTTALSLDGRPAKGEQVQPGDDVRAAYRVVDGKPTAVRIEVTRSSDTGSVPPQR